MNQVCGQNHYGNKLLKSIRENLLPSLNDPYPVSGECSDVFMEVAWKMESKNCLISLAKERKYEPLKM